MPFGRGSFALKTHNHKKAARMRAIAALGLPLVMLCFFARPGHGQISDEVLERQISSYANDLCGTCHDRRSGSELAPRIAGQQRNYIEAQLEAFRRQSRAEPEAHDCMWGLSSALSDRLVTALAGYFATQTPRAGLPGEATQIDAGRALFTRNDRDHAIPSCAQCHGESATGAGKVPRLAGQLAPYLIRQMHVIRSEFRSSEAMHGIVKYLNDEELRSLSVYLQSL
jgi:cytochrome c553